jgi:aspartate/methionine/tyrosine aminotransferase
MKQPPFLMERWQSLYENEVEFNLSESGVLPFTLEGFCEFAGVEPGGTKLGYGQTDGSEDLRERIAAIFPECRADNVVATTGSVEANFVSMWRLVEPGDRVVVVQPAYAQTPGLASGLGAEVTALWLEEERGWQPAPGAAQELICPGTKLVVITSPNNPTGALLAEEAAAEIASAADRNGAWILADEVYAGAELSGEPAASFWGRAERVLVSGSLSKAYGLPGLRLGWIVGPAGWRDELWARKDYTTIAPSALSDRLATAALDPATRSRLLNRGRGIMRANLETLTEWAIAHQDVLRFRRPEAGAIAFFGYELPIGSAELAERLRVDKSVLLVPGVHFGLEGYFRVGYGYEGAKLAAALRRLSELLSELRAGAAV